MATKKAKATAGERIAADFVGPHPTLARRIDAAIRRAAKREATFCFVNCQPVSGSVMIPSHRDYLSAKEKAPAGWVTCRVDRVTEPAKRKSTR